MCGFGVACPARTRDARGDGLKEVDVPVVSSADGRWNGRCGVDDGTSELAVGSRLKSTSLIGTTTAFVTAASTALRVAVLVTVLMAAAVVAMTAAL